MKREVRRKIELALRVREFCRAHPFTDPSSTTVVARLEERLTRAEALAVQQRTSQLAAIAANARRNQLRDAPLTQLLRHLVHVAEASGKDVPALAGILRLPSQDGSNQTFLAAARAMIQTADTHRDTLVGHGMPEAMLADLGHALTDFEAAAEAAVKAKRDRVGAGADLDEVMRDLSAAVVLLDGLNQYRFRSDAETLAAWSNLILLVSFPTRKPEPKQPPASGGDIKAAA